MAEGVDLNTLGATPPAGTATPPSVASSIVEKPYDPTADRETIRGTIAQALIWTLVAVIGAVVLTGLFTVYSCNAKDACTGETIELKTIRVVTELVLTPLIGLVGAVTGFYFGEKSSAGSKAGS